MSPTGLLKKDGTPPLQAPPEGARTEGSTDTGERIPAPSAGEENPAGSGLQKPDRKMSKRSRVLIAVAALALSLVYVQPLWKIALEAPQYPEGIGMQIWVNDIRGEKPNDLKNINGLNHYIGMKTIEPDSIQELVIMPWIIGALLLSGLLVALIGNRKLLYLWAALFVLVALAGMVAIKIPGMSYQPPLIGSKQLLNFVASSWPGPGGWAAVFSCATGCLVAAGEFLRARRSKKVT
jgi:copper chaperone NosL